MVEELDGQLGVRGFLAESRAPQILSNPISIGVDEEILEGLADENVLRIDPEELGGGGVGVLDLAIDDEKQADGIRLHQQPESLLRLDQIPLHPLVIRHIVDEEDLIVRIADRLQRSLHEPVDARGNFKLDFAGRRAPGPREQPAPIPGVNPIRQTLVQDVVGIGDAQNRREATVAVDDFEVSEPGDAVHG